MRFLSMGLVLATVSLAGCDPESPPNCTDHTKNGDEADVDCGGSCAIGCEAGQSCQATNDCVSGFCNTNTGRCAEPTCEDGVQNGTELGIDCGGLCTALCADGTTCTGPELCLSGFCTPDTHICASPGCEDGYQTDGEIDIDCGGDCGLCDDGQHCDSSADCTSDFCHPTDGLCVSPNCHDGFQNSGETDTDCGGGCDPCQDGDGCAAPGDCTSNYCQPDAHVCAPNACHDSALSPDETDVDCGGPCGASCVVDDDCLVDDDCASTFCFPTDHTCQTPVCGDGFQNRHETDIDCGGECDDTCEVGETCADDGDCVSGFCLPTDHTCQVPDCPDGFENGGETGLDCGGSCATACPDSQGCADNDDCVHAFCRPTDHTCRTPTCADGFQNRDESDIDCGGICGPTCDAGEICSDDGDCVSDDCSGTCVSNLVTLTFKSLPDRGGADHTWGEIEASPPGQTFCSSALQETHQYAIGTVVTLTAHEDVVTWPFTSWSVTPGGLGGQDAAGCTITVTMDQDKTVTATFPAVSGGPNCP